MKKDIFEKCSKMREAMRKFILSDPESAGLNTDLDVNREDDLVYVGYELFYGNNPINNGGPVMPSKDGGEYLQFSTNDYFGMSQNRDIHEFSIDFIKNYTIGSPMGSRLLSGSTELHNQLEEEVASFKKAEDSVTFTTGANAMIGALSCLADKNDLLILDQFVHSSLNCGAKISGAEIKRFRHNDLVELEDILKKADKHRGKLIVIDGVYSMEGDIAPLREICDLKEKYGARLLVDDAHGNGVFGCNGGGVAEVEGVEERIDIQAGTFSKAFGSSGGFIASSRDVVEFIRFWAPTMLFTKAQPALIAAVNLKALKYIRAASGLRDRLHANASYLQSKLIEKGFSIGNTKTPITPLTFPGHHALYLVHVLRKKYRIWVNAVMFPAIPMGKSIIRIIPTVLHTKEHLDYLCDSIYTAYNELLGARSYSRSTIMV